MKQFKLTPAQRHRLENVVHRTRDARKLRQALALLEAHRGRSILEVARLVGVSWRSIYLWIEDFRIEAEAGKLGLRSDPGGRPSLWTEELEEFLLALLSHSPDQLGYPRVSWTIPLLREHLHHWVREDLSEHTIRRHLHKLGYSWKRPRYVLLPDPNRAKKVAKIRGKIAQLDDRSVILFEDETDLLLFPPLRSAWAERGIPARVPITGWNAKRVIFGAINARTGSCLFLARSNNRAEDFQFFLRSILWHYRGWHIVIVLDEAKSHTARSSEILARGLGIDLIWLPHRSPELNPLDTLWGKAKDILCANRQYEDIDDQADQFITFLQDLSSAEILKKAGLNADTFWLWKN